MVTLSYPSKICTAPSVVFVNLIAGNFPVLTIPGEDFDLMGYAVAVPLVLIIAGEPDVEGCPFFIQIA